MIEQVGLDFFVWNAGHETQEEFVLRVLKAQGFITRNFCLQRYISRLGAYICQLKKQGYVIGGYHHKTQNGTDYRYDLIGDNHDKEKCHNQQGDWLNLPA